MGVHARLSTYIISLPAPTALWTGYSYPHVRGEETDFAESASNPGLSDCKALGPLRLSARSTEDVDVQRGCVGGGPGLPTVLCEPARWCGQHPLSLELASEQAGTSPHHPPYKVEWRIRCDP